MLKRIQYVFQDPYTALNPRKTVGQLVAQPIDHFYGLPRAEADARVVKVLEDVSLSAEFLNRYPDQLSGGERQRAAIARALAAEPDLLVCDEVSSALDVSVQATIIELLRRLQAEHRLAMLFITHNLALVRGIAQSVIVLSQGRVVEEGPVEEVFERPATLTRSASCRTRRGFPPRPPGEAGSYRRTRRAGPRRDEEGLMDRVEPAVGERGDDSALVPSTPTWRATPPPGSAASGCGSPSSPAVTSNEVADVLDAAGLASDQPGAERELGVRECARPGSGGPRRAYGRPVRQAAGAWRAAPGDGRGRHRQRPRARPGRAAPDAV